MNLMIVTPRHVPSIPPEINVGAFRIFVRSQPKLLRGTLCDTVVLTPGLSAEQRLAGIEASRDRLFELREPTPSLSDDLKAKLMKAGVEFTGITLSPKDTYALVRHLGL